MADLVPDKEMLEDIAQLAHRIRGRASAIGMVLDLIQRQKLPDGICKYIGTIRRANDSILRYVDAMQEFPDLEGTKLSVSTIENLVEQIWNELQGVFDPSETDFGIDIPKVLLNEKVEVDVNQIAEAFVNLMQNSQEAIEGKSRIALSVWLEADHVYLSWQDDGPGISERDAESLFKMGFTTKPRGDGIGLYSTKRMLLNNRGDIWLDRSGKKESGNYAARFVMKIPLLRTRSKSQAG